MKFKTLIILCLCLQMVFCATPQSRLAKAREKDPRYQYNMGLFYLNSGQLDLAIEYLNKSLSFDPKNHLALNALGLAYSMKGNFDESIKYFSACLEINPSLAEAHNNLGSVYQEKGDLEKAEKHFLAASLDTKYSSRELPFYNLARLYFTQNNIQNALYNVQKSLELKNDFLLALNLEGLIYSKMGQMERAILSFEKALKIGPADIDLNFNLGEAYFKNRQFEKARQLFSNIYPQVKDEEMKKKIEEYLSKIRTAGSESGVFF